MLKEVRILRKHIRGMWDGSLIKISEKGQPDKFQQADEYLIGLTDEAIRAVRDDCARECDKMAVFYRELRDRGPREYSKDFDMDMLRMFAAERCAAAIRGRNWR